MTSLHCNLKIVIISIKIILISFSNLSDAPAEIVGSNPTQAMDICVVSVVCRQVEFSATD